MIPASDKEFRVREVTRAHCVVSHRNTVHTNKKQFGYHEHIEREDEQEGAIVSETKWTREVEYISAERKGRTGYAIIRDEKGEYVGKVLDTFGIAHLIAAAPELYEALQYAHRELEALAFRVDEASRHDLLHLNTQEALGNAHAALAKARGEAQS